MSTTEGPLPRRWYTAGTNLEVWGEAGTYKAVPYEALPPLPATTTDSFAWLTSAPVSPHGLDFGDDTIGEDASGDDASNEDDETAQDAIDARLARLVFDATKLGFTVPPALIAFFVHPELRRRVPSCTACYLDVPTKLVELPGGRPGRLLRFMNDQQCCILWYVHLEAGGGHSVVCAAPEWIEGAVGESLEDVTTPRDLEMCAPDFETFMHRFWMENSLWFAVSKGGPLTAEQKAYAAAAKSARAAP